jgi:molecular chaperone Hsp33
MLLADCTDTGELRGYARFDTEMLDALLAKTPDPAADALLGSGYLAFTVDQGGDNRHQGIVAIEGDTLATMSLHYFETSEQLRCQIHLACAKTESGWRAAALILEKVAGAGGIAPELNEDAQEESWRTAWSRRCTARASCIAPRISRRNSMRTSTGCCARRLPSCCVRG